MLLLRALCAAAALLRAACVLPHPRLLLPPSRLAEIVAAIERGDVLACQFHPELSGAWGAELLGRWVEGRC